MKKIISFLACFTGLAHVCDAGTVTANFTSATTIPVTAASYTATGNDVTLSLGFAPPTGTNLTIVKNTGLSVINGQFSNLAQGQYVILYYNGVYYKFAADYYGGSGNDLVLHWAHRSPIAWGENNYGQLGNGNTINSNVPVLVNAENGILANKTAVSVAHGRHFGLALCSNGEIAAWGRGSDGGLLGDGTMIDSSVPVPVNQSGVLLGKRVISIAAGDYHSLVLCSDGTVSSWGNNSSGELGNGSTNDSNVPVSTNISGAVSVAAGNNHSLALLNYGKVSAWGQNTFGQLGNGTTTDSSLPDLVSNNGALSGKTVISIAAGGDHSLALCSDGTIEAWGGNSGGELGNGTTTDSSLPVGVTKTGALSGKTVVSIAAGSGHNLALCSDGTLTAWGDNTYGQLGNGTTTGSSVPVKVTISGKTVRAIAAGWFHSLALCSDGTVIAWGRNDAGQLGNGNNNSSSVPVLAQCSNVVAISAGGRDSLGLSAYWVSCDAALADLSLSISGMSPVFSPTTINYMTNVGNETSSISVRASARDPATTIKVNGMTAVSGSNSSPIPLQVGINTILVVATAQDNTKLTYTISVARAGSYNYWRENVFSISERNDPSVSGEMASPAGDGITNLMKYALGLAPKANGVSGLPSVASQDGYLTLTYRKNKQATDVNYTVQAGDGLSENGWSEASTVVSQTDEGDYWLVTVRDNVTQAGHPTRFMRLKVAK